MPCLPCTCHAHTTRYTPPTAPLMAGRCTHGWAIHSWPSNALMAEPSSSSRQSGGAPRRPVVLQHRSPAHDAPASAGFLSALLPRACGTPSSASRPMSMALQAALLRRSLAAHLFRGWSLTPPLKSVRLSKESYYQIKRRALTLTSEPQLRYHPGRWLRPVDMAMRVASSVASARPLNTIDCAFAICLSSR